MMEDLYLEHFYSLPYMSHGLFCCLPSIKNNCRQAQLLGNMADSL
jgi:hypothetical protein